MDMESYCEIGDCNNAADRAHLITQANLPICERDNPIFYVYLCRRHHLEQHQIGIETFCIEHSLMTKLHKARDAYTELFVED